ncbi:hypothetical protein pb186bvf_012959 [Paramecium bursaria]
MSCRDLIRNQQKMIENAQPQVRQQLTFLNQMQIRSKIPRRIQLKPICFPTDYDINISRIKTDSDPSPKSTNLTNSSIERNSRFSSITSRSNSKSIRQRKSQDFRFQLFKDILEQKVFELDKRLKQLNEGTPKQRSKSIKI